MRGKKLLAAFLLGVGLCFVPVFGYGEVEKTDLPFEIVNKVPYRFFFLLKARVNYMMCNPTNFLYVDFHDDWIGLYRREFPEAVDTKGKVYVLVRDNRGLFSRKSKIVLLELFKRELEVICSYIGYYSGDIDMDMNTEIVAKFYSEGNIPLGYFYQGEYYLWEK